MKKVIIEKYIAAAIILVAMQINVVSACQTNNREPEIQIMQGGPKIEILESINVHNRDLSISNRIDIEEILIQNPENSLLTLDYKAALMEGINESYKPKKDNLISKQKNTNIIDKVYTKYKIHKWNISNEAGEYDPQFSEIHLQSIDDIISLNDRIFQNFKGQSIHEHIFF